MSTALQPIEQKEVEFYGDMIPAAIMEDGQILIPVKPLATFLGLDWSAQYRRLRRDSVLGDAIRMVKIQSTGDHDRGLSDAVAIPIEYLPGYLFGIDDKRVAPELQPRILRYKRECFSVLWEAFSGGRLTDIQPHAYTPAAAAYQTALVVAELARQQMNFEAALSEHDSRIESLEAAIAGKASVVTQVEASQISQAVKAIALTSSRLTGSNQYGAVYGELYRRYGVTSYKLIPRRQFSDVMEFLTDWHNALADGKPAIPF